MNIYRVNMTQAEYNAYIAVPTNTVPNNYQIFITDAPAGTPNLYTGTGTNTPTSGTSGGGTGGFNNFTATTAPTATDDSADGYTIGSRWIDTTNDESYICVDATLGSAVWSKTTVGIISEVAGLQGALDAKLDDTDIVNDLTTGGTTKVLSAEQGKNLETNKEPKVTGKGLSTNDYTTTEKNKLAGVATGATANDTDANLKARANHTGTQAQSTITDLTTDLAGKSATTHNHTGTYEPADATILKEAEIVNTLVGTDTNKPLSAAQGKALQDGKRELYSLGHPYHTAATEAGHIVTGTSQFNADYAPWKALQASPVGLSEWATAGATAASLTYQLPQATVFNRVVLMGRLSGIEYPTIWSIEGSNDGTTYTTLVASHTESLQAEVTKDFTNTTAYKYYRFSYTAVVGTNSGLNHIRYYHTGINYLPILPNSVSVKVTRSTAQSLSSAGTIVSWDTVDHEVGATTLWDVANPTRLTAPVAGTYIVVADIAAESDSVGQITIMRNGTAVHNGTAPRFWTGSGSTSALVRLSVGDYIECQVSPATTVNSIVAAERHYLSMVFVSL